MDDIVFGIEADTFGDFGYNYCVRHYDGIPIAWGILKSDLRPVINTQTAPENYRLYNIRTNAYED